MIRGLSFTVSVDRYARKGRKRTVNLCTARFDSTELFFRKQQPSGKEPISGRPLVLLHPTYLHSEIFTPQLDQLSKFLEVIAVDLRGYGRSSVPAEGERYSHAEDLRKFLDEGGHPVVHILGVEMGAAVALDFAECFPARVDSMILVNPSAFLYAFPATSFFNVTEALEAGGVTEARSRWLARSDYDFTRTLKPVFWFVEQVMAEYQGYHFLCDDYMTWKGNGLDAYGAIETRTLILNGEFCGEDYRRISSYLSTMMTNLTLHEIKTSGMLPNLENIKEFNDIVLSFVSGRES
ncbi:hypothetical protein NDN08_008369 [Rhodosorus marinus]|uniref:AB hydrolase-1 domain-containing protein n=1 Tax=Rhodosorus marinus TaxID=101924 RepID=A0AAV8V309_9RHOD|nr:hypothetical protein NDN08_008369 [Rhodosorus marinus]